MRYSTKQSLRRLTQERGRNSQKAPTGKSLLLNLLTTEYEFRVSPPPVTPPSIFRFPVYDADKEMLVAWILPLPIPAS